MLEKHLEEEYLGNLYSSRSVQLKKSEKAQQSSVLLQGV